MSVSRLHWTEAKVVHCSSDPTSKQSPSSKACDYDLSSTDPSSISLEFIACGDAFVLQQGKARTLRIVPGAITLCGPEPIRWLGSSGHEGGGEFIEITASENFRNTLAEELDAPSRADLDDIHGWSDPIVWAIATRFRSAALRTIHINDLERDFLMRRLYGRVLEVQFGVRGPARGYGRLDQVRLHRIVDFIEAHLDDYLTTETLSHVAALSPFHFVRAFRQSFGLTPHRYVRARRLERARHLLASGQPARAVARWIGYESVSHFRAAYFAQFGVTCEHDERPGRCAEPPSRYGGGHSRPSSKRSKEVEGGQ